MARRKRTPIHAHAFGLRDWSERRMELRVEMRCPSLSLVILENVSCGDETEVTLQDVDAAIEWLYRVRSLFAQGTQRCEAISAANA